MVARVVTITVAVILGLALLSIDSTRMYGYTLFPGVSLLVRARLVTGRVLAYLV
jgi:hypothetical protein